MKILVTGANGYLGQGVVKALLARGAQVVATDIATDCVDSRAQRIAADLFSVTDPYSYFGQPDAVLHLAWRDGFQHNAPSHLGCLQQHCAFLESLAKAGVKQMAVMGSMHEVGFHEGSIDENTPCNPLSCYGIAKNALRQYTQLLAKSYGFTLQWLRGYYIVGNTEYGNSIFSKIAAAAKAGKKEFPFTLGLNQFDFVDYEEFCRQTAAVVLQTQVTGIINICSGRPEKLADRVERFIRENGYDIQLQYGAFPDRPYDSKAVWGSCDKIAAILQMQAQKEGGQ